MLQTGVERTAITRDRFFMPSNQRLSVAAGGWVGGRLDGLRKGGRRVGKLGGLISVSKPATI